MAFGWKPAYFFLLGKLYRFYCLHGVDSGKIIFVLQKKVVHLGKRFTVPDLSCLRAAIFTCPD